MRERVCLSNVSAGALHVCATNARASSFPSILPGIDENWKTQRFLRIGSSLNDLLSESLIAIKILHYIIINYNIACSFINFNKGIYPVKVLVRGQKSTLKKAERDDGK